MKISLNTPTTFNLEKIQQIKSIIEKNIGQNRLSIKNLEPEELYDYQKIMQVCEFVLVKYENKKSLYENLKKVINALDSTMQSIEYLDEEINELSISADLSMNRLKDFKANLLKPQEHEYPHVSN
jgi:hypothetical protein